MNFEPSTSYGNGNGGGGGGGSVEDNELLHWCIMSWNMQTQSCSAYIRIKNLVIRQLVLGYKKFLFLLQNATDPMHDLVVKHEMTLLKVCPQTNFYVYKWTFISKPLYFNWNKSFNLAFITYIDTTNDTLLYQMSNADAIIFQYKNLFVFNLIPLYKVSDLYHALTPIYTLMEQETKVWILFSSFNMSPHDLQTNFQKHCPNLITFHQHGITTKTNKNYDFGISSSRVKQTFSFTIARDIYCSNFTCPIEITMPSCSSRIISWNVRNLHKTSSPYDEIGILMDQVSTKSMWYGHMHTFEHLLLCFQNYPYKYNVTKGGGSNPSIINPDRLDIKDLQCAIETRLISSQQYTLCNVYKYRMHDLCLMLINIQTTRIIVLVTSEEDQPTFIMGIFACNTYYFNVNAQGCVPTISVINRILNFMGNDERWMLVGNFNCTPDDIKASKLQWPPNVYINASPYQTTIFKERHQFIIVPYKTKCLVEPAIWFSSNHVPIIVRSCVLEKKVNVDNDEFTNVI